MSLPAPIVHRGITRTFAKGAGALVAASLLLASSPARARCPRDLPGDPVCDPYVAILMPTAVAVAWFPRAAGGAYFGGGVELGLISWSSNNDNFGPSHGRLYMSAAYLASTQKSRAVLYRFGGVVSFESNASRRFMIPHFGAALGGLWQSELGAKPAFDASLGLYLVHTRRFVLDAEGGVVLPFNAVDQLVGPRAQLTASFALW